jgi:CheY-like chemotaxis protein
LCEALAGLADEQPDARSAESQDRVDTHGSAFLRILLAEDNLVNQRLAAIQLRKLGHEVSVVANGQEALDALEHERFDAVIVDVHMPVMDGLETVERIRAREAELREGNLPTPSGSTYAHQRQSGRSIPVIAVTAMAMHGDRERCLQVGMSAYITKPVKASELVAALDGVPADVPDDTSSPAADNGIAYATALLALDGDAALLRELFVVFLDEYEAQLGDVRRAVQHGNAADLELAAHTLKGSLRTFGSRASDAAFQLEMMGRMKNLSEAHSALSELEAEVARFIRDFALPVGSRAV